MSMFLCVLFPLLVIESHALTECETDYRGTCHSMFGTCQSGQKSTISHCGFLRMCCYDESKPQTGTVSPLTGNGQCGHPLVTSDERIIGGSPVMAGEFPWQVSLRYQGQHLCGGTLIDRQWVVTAAHCFDDTYQSGWTVLIGSTNLNRIYSSQIYRAAHIVSHAGYDAVTNAYDIGMIKLEKPVDITQKDARTACLPAKTEDFSNDVCTVTGWGSTRSGGPGSSSLNKVSIPVVTNSLCKYYLRTTIYDHNICAGISGGRDACQGDSGGPLVCLSGGSWKLAGIVSWGYGCGDQYTPGVYTRVSSFIDWINNVKQDYP